MKKLLLGLAILLVCAVSVRAESLLVFCDTFDDQFKPQNVGKVFPGPGLSMILAQDKPFGVPSLVVTIYKRDGRQESLLERAEFEINPRWSAYGIRNVPMPGPGSYSIAFTLPGGETVAHGEVEIMGGAGKKPAAPQETLGGTLERAFNKYAPKKQ